MCGIAGILQKQKGICHPEQVRAMNQALAHRGPDGEGYWENEAQNIMLGHRRLSVIDLSAAGHQPMHYRDRYTIVHNGEIYNYVEIKKTLQTEGYTFHSQTDTEVILAAYDYWKEDCVQELDGMFAFVIWDEKEQTLFAARDRFGEKPLFYFLNQEQFVFASEIKALFAAGVPRRPNLKLLFNFITIGYTDNPEEPEETFYEEVQKLPAASYLICRLADMKPEIVRYWDIDPDQRPLRIKEDEAIAQFTALLEQSVKRRLRSDVRLGTSLSGGLDSSSILAIASACTNGQPLSTFTASFPGYEKDETELAASVARKSGAAHKPVLVTAAGLLHDWDKLKYQQDEPFGSASIYAQYKVYEQAATSGVTVLLDGQGADETLAGYTKYFSWFWQELFRRRRLRKSGEIPAARALGIQTPFTYQNKIAAYFPDFATVVMERRYLVRALKQEDLHPDYIRFQSCEAYYTTPPHFTLNGVLYFNTITHGLEELLRYADRNAMAFGREVRLPFLSHELVEFAFSLPAELKIRQGRSKWILRESMKDRLPESIVWRKDKCGFEPPQHSWMENPAVQDLIMESRRKLVDAGVLKSSVMQKPVQALAAHEADNFDWRYLSASVLF